MTSLNSILLRALDRYKVIVLQTAELQPRYVSSKLLCFVVISFTQLTTAGGRYLIAAGSTQRVTFDIPSIHPLLLQFIPEEIIPTFLIESDRGKDIHLMCS